MKRGLCIAVFGPDGVGKSAVIQRLPSRLGNTFSGYIRFHFRPHFGSAPDGSSVSSPHAQTPRGIVTSVCKLMYWLLDCWTGYFAVVLPARRRSHLVIFDRYLIDVTVDPVRYRLPPESMRLLRAVARLAPKPDVYILLDAPPAAVRRRKREIAPAESHRQRTAYLKLFDQLPNALVIDANRPIEEVVAETAAAISSFLPSRGLPIANLRSRTTGFCRTTTH